jgi:hypothetical protein
MVDAASGCGSKDLRETAEKLKAMARRTRSIEARETLLDLAVRFERMARCMDGASPPG